MLDSGWSIALADRGSDAHTRRRGEVQSSKTRATSCAGERHSTPHRAFVAQMSVALSTLCDERSPMMNVRHKLLLRISKNLTTRPGYCIGAVSPLKSDPTFRLVRRAARCATPVFALFPQRQLFGATRKLRGGRRICPLPFLPGDSLRR